MKKLPLLPIILMLLGASCSEAPKQTPTEERAPTTLVPVHEDTIKPKFLAHITDTIQASWRCFGTEPFWSVEISEAKNTIKYKTMEGDSTLMPFVKGVEKDSSWIFNAAKLNVVIKKEKCNDGMSDTEHEYSANVTIAGKELKGCARRLENK